MVSITIHIEVQLGKYEKNLQDCSVLCFLMMIVLILFVLPSQLYNARIIINLMRVKVQ